MIANNAKMRKKQTSERKPKMPLMLKKTKIVNNPKNAIVEKNAKSAKKSKKAEIQTSQKCKRIERIQGMQGVQRMKKSKENKNYKHC